jgi:undecaprenyl-diphosphatase
MTLKLSLGSLIIFILITLDVIFEGLFTKIDYALLPIIFEYHSSVLDKIMLVITTMGNMKSMVIFSTIISLVLWYKKDYLSIKFFLASMIGSSLLMSGLKEFVGRIRPQNYVIDMFQHGNSFPSGHASASMALSLGLFFIIYPHISKISQKVLIVVLASFAILISISRLYFGVHYLSDVSGGATLSIFWVLLMAWAFKIENT